MSINNLSGGASSPAASGCVNYWTDEPNEIVRLARLEEAALLMMGGDGVAAFRWLHSPLSILHDQTPLEHARTGPGARHVDDLIKRRMNGVFC